MIKHKVSAGSWSQSLVMVMASVNMVLIATGIWSEWDWFWSWSWMRIMVRVLVFVMNEVLVWMSWAQRLFDSCYLKLSWGSAHISCLQVCLAPNKDRQKSWFSETLQGQGLFELNTPWDCLRTWRWKCKNRKRQKGTKNRKTYTHRDTQRAAGSFRADVSQM